MNIGIKDLDLENNKSVISPAHLGGEIEYIVAIGMKWKVLERIQQ